MPTTMSVHGGEIRCCPAAPTRDSMGGMSATMSFRRLATGVAVVCTLAGCAGGAVETPYTITATPDFTPTPRPSPTPAQALNPDHLWITSDAHSEEVLGVSPDGAVTRVRLPLNEGQSGSELTASPDGRYLAYLVWNDQTEQHGIAMWNLAEANARLIMQPLPGYRIIDLLFAAESSTLLYVQAQLTEPNQPQWRLESIPVGGGQPALLADAASAPDLLPPNLIGWPAGGPLYLSASARQTADSPILQAVYRLDPTTGAVTLATSGDDSVILYASLSPDGTQLAYTTYVSEPGGLSAARVLDLQQGAVTTLPAPDQGTVLSVEWLDDSRRVLLDLLTSATDQSSQTFALTEVPGELPWPQLPADPARAQLFTYCAYGDGVAYTLYPEADDAPWTLVLFPEINAGAEPETISLEHDGGGAPRILRAP